ncbi:DUF6895 family protein [Streptomyces sp. NPDC057702]|uniref:DUF6895 family protein n=1 Tax=unclassified Streptomyces TaxID=2593676 RepID=UPI0036A50162
MTSSAMAERVADGALGWIDENLSYFDPFKDGELTGLCEIPLTELAILTYSAQRSARHVDAAVIARFLDFMEAAYRRPVYQERPFREPETLVSHLVVAAALAHGRRLDGASYQRVVERLVRASTVTAPSLPPHRMMELRHALDLSGVRHDLPSYPALYRGTMPARPVNPVYVTRAEVYVLTHVIFYAADLGHRPARGMSDGERGRLARLVDRLLGMCIAARDWDLTAELILSARCLRRPAFFEPWGWECLVATQRADGSVPGLRARLAQAEAAPRDPARAGARTRRETPGESLGELNGEPDTEPGAGPDAEATVDSRYHTTLVSALAALATLRDG